MEVCFKPETAKFHAGFGFAIPRSDQMKRDRA
jgi:hypothetical protein